MRVICFVVLPFGGIGDASTASPFVLIILSNDDLCRLVYVKVKITPISNQRIILFKYHITIETLILTLLLDVFVHSIHLEFDINNTNFVVISIQHLWITHYIEIHSIYFFFLNFSHHFFFLSLRLHSHCNHTTNLQTESYSPRCWWCFYHHGWYTITLPIGQIETNRFQSAHFFYWNRNSRRRRRRRVCLFICLFCQRDDANKEATNAFPKTVNNKKKIRIKTLFGINVDENNKFQFLCCF